MEHEEYEKSVMANQSLANAAQLEQLYESLQIDSSKDLLRVTLDSSDLLESLELKLRGIVMRYDESSGELIPKRITKQLLNEEGINAILQYIMVMSGSSQIMANYADFDVYQALENLAIVLVLELAANSKRYELDDSSRDRVIIMVMQTAKNFMTRSIGRQEGKDVYGRTKAVEHLQRTSGTEEKSGGFRWLGFGGNK